MLSDSQKRHIFWSGAYLKVHRDCSAFLVMSGDCIQDWMDMKIFPWHVEDLEDGVQNTWRRQRIKRAQGSSVQDSGRWPKREVQHSTDHEAPLVPERSTRGCVGHERRPSWARRRCTGRLVFLPASANSMKHTCSLPEIMTISADSMRWLKWASYKIGQGVFKNMSFLQEGIDSSCCLSWDNDNVCSLQCPPIQTYIFVKCCN